MFLNSQQQWKGLLLSLIVFTQYMHCIGHEVHFHPQKNDELQFHTKTIDFYGKREVGKPKEKRLIVAILFAVSIFATLANLAFDLYLQIKGCCGLYPSACTYRDKFNRVKDDIEKRVNRMNDEYAKAKTSLDYVKQTNQENQNILQELVRIMTLQKRVIETLDTQVLNKLYNKSTDLKMAMEKHNATIAKWSFAQLTTEWNGVFSSVESAALGLGPLVGLLGVKAIFSGIKWYKNYKIAQAVKAQSSQLAAAGPKASKVLGISSVKATTAQTITAQQKAASGVAKMSKFAKFAGAAMSVISIGFEIYMAVRKVKACKDVRDGCRKAYNEIKGEPAKMKTTENELKTHQADLAQTYLNVTSQVTSDTFLEHVLSMKQLAQGADVQTEKLKQAAKYMQEFHDNIKKADRNAFISLQKKLYKGMTDVEFTWLCFDKKIGAVSYVYDHCKKGSNTFTLLYNNAASLYSVNSKQCVSSVGHQYMTVSETKKFIDGRMKEEGYLSDCILNSKTLRYLVCQDYVDDYSKNEIASRNQLSISQVTYVISICPPAEVSPIAKNLICAFKSSKKLAEVKKEFSKYDQSQVDATYKACPTPKMTDAIRSKICEIKFSKKSESVAISAYSQYGSTVVRNVYRACVLTLKGSERNTLCIGKKYQVSFDNLYADPMFSKYPRDFVLGEYNKCT